MKLVPVHSLVNETRKPVSESNSAYDVANSPSTGDPFEVIKDNVRLYHTSPQIETLTTKKDETLKNACKKCENYYNEIL